MFEMMLMGGLPPIKPIGPDKYNWSKLSIGGLPAITLPTVVGYNDYIYFFGGVISPNPTNAILRQYNIVSKTWTILSCPLSSRYDVGLVVRDNKMYIIGGTEVATQTKLNEVWSWNIGTDQWVRLTNAPVSATGRSHVIQGDDIYAAGGWDGTKPVATTSVYNIPTNKWTNIATLPEGRYSGKVVILNDVLYYLYGMADSGGVNTVRKTIYSLPLGGNVWTLVPGVSSSGVMDMEVCSIGDKAYIHGGRVLSTSKNDINNFNGVKLTTGVKTIPWPEAAYSSAMIAHLGKLYLYGGTDDKANRLNDFWECTITN